MAVPSARGPRSGSSGSSTATATSQPRSSRLALFQSRRIYAGRSPGPDLVVLFHQHPHLLLDRCIEIIARPGNGSHESETLIEVQEHALSVLPHDFEFAGVRGVSLLFLYHLLRKLHSCKCFVQALFAWVSSLPL